MSDSGDSRRSRAIAKRIGVSGFLSSCATCRADSRSAVARSASSARVAPEPQLRRHLAHPVAQDDELRRSLSRRTLRQRLAAPDRLRPSHQLAQRPAQIAAQVSRHARRDDAEEQRRTERGQRRHRRRAPRHQELHLPRAQQPLVERTLRARPAGARCPATAAPPAPPLIARSPDRRDPLHRRRRPEQRQRPNHRQLPRRRENDRRDEREGEEDQEETSAETDLLHWHPYAARGGAFRRNILAAPEQLPPCVDPLMRVHTDLPNLPDRQAPGDHRHHRRRRGAAAPPPASRRAWSSSRRCTSPRPCSSTTTSPDSGPTSSTGSSSASRPGIPRSYRHNSGTGEDNAAAHLRSLAIGHEVIVPVTAGEARSRSLAARLLRRMGRTAARSA